MVVNFIDSRNRVNKNFDLADVSGWVAVESLPEEVSRVLLIMQSGLISVGYLWKEEWYMNDTANKVTDVGYSVTHWMRLPLPPCT